MLVHYFRIYFTHGLLFRSAYADASLRAKQIWGYQRYQLILEYTNRSVLVPPFVFLSHMWDLLCAVYNFCYKKKGPSVVKVDISSKPEEVYRRRMSTRRSIHRRTQIRKESLHTMNARAESDEKFSRFSKSTYLINN